MFLHICHFSASNFSIGSNFPPTIPKIYPPPQMIQVKASVSTSTFPLFHQQKIMGRPRPKGSSSSLGEKYLKVTNYSSRRPWGKRNNQKGKKRPNGAVITSKWHDLIINLYVYVSGASSTRKMILGWLKRSWKNPPFPLGHHPLDSDHAKQAESSHVLIRTVCTLCFRCVFHWEKDYLVGGFNHPI